MQNMELKKRQLEENYDCLSEELSKLQTAGTTHTHTHTHTPHTHTHTFTLTLTLTLIYTDQKYPIKHFTVVFYFIFTSRWQKNGSIQTLNTIS